MSIAPPPSNSSASSTTDVAPTHTTSKVLEGHQPSVPASVSDKYKEGLEDSSKRPKQNIQAQEDFIKSLPRKDVSFGAEAALDRDRVPLVKRTEVHAVPAETSQEHLLKDKHIEAADVQIPPTQSQSETQKEKEKEKEKENEIQHDKENMQASKPALESGSMSSKPSSPSPSMSLKQSYQSESTSTSSKQPSPSESKSNSSKQESQPPSMSSTQQEADKKQDGIQASTESCKEELSKQDKQLEASATQHQQNLIAEKKQHEDKIETETPQFKQNIEKHNQQVEQKEKSNADVPTPPTKESHAEKSTAKKCEDAYVEPFDIPRTKEQADQTREKPAETRKSSGVLPTDQYDLQSESNSSNQESGSTKPESNSNSNQQDSKLIETIKSSESVIQEKLAGLVHTITHDLPTAARELLNEYEASKSKSNKTEKSSSDGGVLPTDQYDLKTTGTQKDATESVKDVDDKRDNVLEATHIEPFDDHKSETSQHTFIHDKLAGLMQTVTHDLPARAKELLSKHEENKSEPPSPTQTPIIQEREEKQMKEQSVGSSSIIKERGLDPEDMLFL